MSTVLISGAGIAGATLAYWLARHGFRVTVVERATGQRSSGSPVDVRGPAVAVAERMGIMPRLRTAATEVAVMSFVNAAGKRVGRINLRAMRWANGGSDIELSRAELVDILCEAARDDAEFRFDDSITALRQDEHGVEVTLDRGGQRRFDLVIGADGLHSAVRALAFGPDPEFVRHLGIYVAGRALDEPAGDPTEVVMHNSPGRAVAIHPGHGSALAAFMFRGPAVPGFDHRDTAQHKRLLSEAFSDVGWRVPELLGHIRAAEDLFFDSVSQVRLPRWSAGRVAVVGDAASCVSLFGDGSTLAIAGAATLADALAANPGDHHIAFRQYETRHRILADPKQRAVGQASALLIPATRAGITARNLATRLWPLAAGLQRAGTALRRA